MRLHRLATWRMRLLIAVPARVGARRQSQAMSIYRKLGAPSRSQAVARPRELGLLEG